MVVRKSVKSLSELGDAEVVNPSSISVGSVGERIDTKTEHFKEVGLSQALVNAVACRVAGDCLHAVCLGSDTTRGFTLQQIVDAIEGAEEGCAEENYIAGVGGNEVSNAGSFDCEACRLSIRGLIKDGDIILNFS